MFCFSIILPITLVEKDKMNLETFCKQGVEDDRDAKTKISFQQYATHTRSTTVFSELFHNYWLLIYIINQFRFSNFISYYIVIDV